MNFLFSFKVGQHGFMKNQTATWGDKHFDSNAGIEEVIKMTLRELQKFHPHVKASTIVRQTMLKNNNNN
jgi:hypothetical protein